MSSRRRPAHPTPKAEKPARGAKETEKQERNAKVTEKQEKVAKEMEKQERNVKETITEKPEEEVEAKETPSENQEITEKEAPVEDQEREAEMPSENQDNAEEKDSETNFSETPTDNDSSEKELSESSESDEKSVQSQQDEADISDDADEKQNADALLSEEDGEKENQSPDGVEKQPKEFRCKYCSFATLLLGDFKDHVDANHPDVILNPLYLCVPCGFRTKKFDSLTEHNEHEHPGDANFQFRKSSEDNQTVLEQTIDASEDPAAKNGPDTAATSPDTSMSASEEIRAVSINGTVIIPEASVLRDSSHVAPMLQRPPNFSCIPKIAVPLNTTKYNPSLDDNVTLIASFNKFPYPTHAELSWLTAASKHPEEQIRVWFTTQRLKQGITWSPEEVEEARKKMFNGSVPATHNTFTVLPTSPVSKAMVHTTTLEPAKHGASSSSPPSALKRTAAAAFGPEPKRPVMVVAPNPGEKGLMAPPAPPLKPLLDAKRINDVKWTPVPLMQPAQTLPKNKIIPNISNSSKTRPLMSMVFPESLTRPMIAPPPIFAPPFKNSILVPRANEKVPISLPNGTLPNSAPLIPPQIRRPAIIQTIRANPSMFPMLEGTPPKEQNENMTKASYNGKWAEQVFSSAHADDPKSDFQQKAQVLTQFPLLERMKGKTSEQLKVLEENFLRNSFPTHSEVESLASSTLLSPSEIDSWFSERRALRDNLEQALLNSMGNKRNGHNGHSAPNGHSGHNGHNTSIGHNAPNGHAASINTNGTNTNGTSANGAVTHGPYTHGPNTNGASENMLQNGVHRVVAHVGAPLSRGPDEPLVSRWSFVDDYTQRWFNSDHLNGKTGSSELIGPTNGRTQEAELSWFNKTLSAHPHERYNRLELGAEAVFGRWIDQRQDVSEES